MIREVLGEDNSLEQEMYYVTFEDGAITTLHYHESEQILISMHGKGVVGIIKENEDISNFDLKDEDLIILDNIGDTICIPANRLHFHGGAISDKDFSHIAIRRSHKFKDGGSLLKAENKWENDLLSSSYSDNHLRKTIQEEIDKKVRDAISKKIKITKGRTA